MIPIAKNINIIDEHGNKYEATYLKRAKGLVKKGRARFINEGTIMCLARPPQTEDNMENINIGNGPRPMKTNDFTLYDENGNATYMGMILANIDSVIGGQGYLAEAFQNVKEIAASADAMGGSGAGADAIVEIVKAHEETNQQALRLLEKMYNDLKS